MKLSKQKGFFCFSPTVMLVTFVIEIILAIYVLTRYRPTRLTQISFGMLGCLALFQMAEYVICSQSAASPAWAKIGYASITLLPPLGLHLAYTLAGRSRTLLPKLAYATAGAWIGILLFSGSAFSGYVCRANYVVFELTPPLGVLYGIYYFTWLFVTMHLLLRFIAQAKKARVRKALMAQLVGYFVFIIPAVIANLVWPATVNGNPSIMCGFAVIFAMILTFKIMPLEREKAATKRIDKTA